jgi:hypothetical protein
MPVARFQSLPAQPVVFVGTPTMRETHHRLSRLFMGKGPVQKFMAEPLIAVQPTSPPPVLPLSQGKTSEVPVKVRAQKETAKGGEGCVAARKMLY